MGNESIHSPLPGIVVSTGCGDVLGESRSGIYLFRGIPYGADCGGARRFLPPLPAEPWEGIRNCTKNGNICYQPDGSLPGAPNGIGDYFNGGDPAPFGVADEKMSEDCLCLDVLTPGCDRKKRPVLVYIHGGGFATGSGTLVLGADRFVSEQDVVLVGLNHRLSFFGFLYLGEYDDKYADSGMAGMLDLVLALQWVKQNIEAFGGDPDAVTIMGESGGGAKVSTLLAMPAARGLFCRAIVESGSLVVGNFGCREAAENTRKLLDALDIPEENWQELLTIPPERMVEVFRRTPDLTIQPVGDNRSLAYQADSRVKAFPQSDDVALVVGASEDEMAVFLPMDKTITWENLPQKLLQRSNDSPSARGCCIREDNVEELIRVFRANNPKQDDALHTFMKMMSMTTALGENSFYQACAKAERGGAPVYSYMVCYDAPHPFTPDRRMAWHTADLPLQMRVVLHPECEILSRTLSQWVGAFVRTGNPSTAALSWPPFTLENHETMLFDDVSVVKNDPYREIHRAIEACRKDT